MIQSSVALRTLQRHEGHIILQAVVPSPSAQATQILTEPNGTQHHCAPIKQESLPDLMQCDILDYTNAADNPSHPTQIDMHDHTTTTAHVSQGPTVESLETKVKIAKTVITNVTNILKHAITQQRSSAGLVDHYLKHAEALNNPTRGVQTVVGIVGNTGAGKSSLLNAVLDEERLLPTNCMRACTACVTEISYNHSNITRQMYAAEIEFVTTAEWTRELEVILGDIIDDSRTPRRLSRDIALQDSAAAVSYAKLRAVYPKLSRAEITRTSVKDLLVSVADVLDNVRKLAAPDAAGFRNEFQIHVDSKDRVEYEADDDDVTPRRPRQRALWPLIKVARLKVKSAVLRSGIVLVDLPGVHDSNAARAAVADRYLKQCSSIWVVAPINRAVDDKAAKMLMGEGFKRRLQYDGIYGAITFVCSRIDDIAISEVLDDGLCSEKKVEVEQRRVNLQDEKHALQLELGHLEQRISSAGGG